MVTNINFVGIFTSHALSLMPAHETRRWIGALTFAIGLHVMLILGLPRFEQSTLHGGLRIEVRLPQSQKASSQAVQVGVEPEPPQPTLTPSETPKSIESQDNQPLLIAQDKVNTQEVFYVPESSENNEPISVAPEFMQATVPSQPSGSQVPSSEFTTIKSSNTVAEGADMLEAEPNEAWSGYGQLLYDMVSKNKRYPQIAVRRNLQGMAMVSARFERGKLVKIIVLQPSSGHKVLDDAALEMLKEAVGAIPIIGNLAKKSFTVVVPVDFKLES